MTREVNLKRNVVNKWTKRVGNVQTEWHIDRLRDIDRSREREEEKEYRQKRGVE